MTISIPESECLRITTSPNEIFSLSAALRLTEPEQHRFGADAGQGAARHILFYACTLPGYSARGPSPRAMNERTNDQGEKRKKNTHTQSVVLIHPLVFLVQSTPHSCHTSPPYLLKSKVFVPITNAAGRVVPPSSLQLLSCVILHPWSSGASNEYGDANAGQENTALHCKATRRCTR